MFAVATDLAYRCGFMCFDDEKHGLAQRYYRLALQLARENGDRTRHGIVLRAMSVQARALGHHRAALCLAETAVEAAPMVDPTRQAFLYGQLAVAHAADGDSIAAAAHLATAERRLDKGTICGPELIGSYGHAALAYQEAAVRGLCGDRPGAITALTNSLRYRQPREQRAKALLLAKVAELQLSCGRLEQATSTWHEFLDSYPQLRTGRANTAFATLHARTRPHHNDPGVRILRRRAATMSCVAEAGDS
jgi:tetratricopeptide (TPR) repeat protein